jgi:hypothetical protein
MEELKFATPEDALQHLADITGSRIKIAEESASSADIDEFKDAYIEAALWSSTDNSNEQGGDPLDDNYDESDISSEMMKDIDEDCKDFVEANFAFIKDDLKQAGHDFWLTRNGHGAGFWDGDWEFEIDGKNAGKHLTEMSKPYGGVDIYVGDDGKLYA